MENFNLDRLFQEQNIEEVNKSSFIAPDLESLITKGKKKTKKVNTKVPSRLFTAFLLLCIKEKKNRKELFPLMLKHFIDKHKVVSFARLERIQNKEIDFVDYEEVNLEYDNEFYRYVQQFKINHRFQYFEIYTQVIIHYLNDKVDESLLYELLRP